MMLKDFIDSIKSISEYNRLKQKKLSKVIVYLLIISVLAGLLFATGIQKRYSEIISLLPENYDSKFPNFKIENGVLSTDKNEQIVIEKGKTAVIFDTTSSADENALSKYKKGVLLLKDSVVIKTSQFSKMERRWSDIFSSNIDKQIVRNYLGIIPSMIMLLTILSIVGFPVINIIVSLFITFVFVLIKRFWKKKLSFMEVFKMTAHSLTVPMVLISLGSVFLGDLLPSKFYYYAYYVSPVYLLIAIGRTDLPKRAGSTIKSQQVKSSNKPKKKQG